MKLSGAEIILILLFGLAFVLMLVDMFRQILPEWQGKKCAEWKPRNPWVRSDFDRCLKWV